MRNLKYTILLANALLIACGEDDNPVEGRRSSVEMEFIDCGLATSE